MEIKTMGSLCPAFLLVLSIGQTQQEGRGQNRTLVMHSGEVQISGTGQNREA